MSLIIFIYYKQITTTQNDIQTKRWMKTQYTLSQSNSATNSHKQLKKTKIYGKTRGNRIVFLYTIFVLINGRLDIIFDR